MSPALLADAEPEGIGATCISSDSDSITVTVNYTNGCRRETVVEASGVTCKPLLEAPAMTIFECGDLHPNTSYNITADSNGRMHSITYCIPAAQKGIFIEVCIKETSIVCIVQSFSFGTTNCNSKWIRTYIDCQ